MKRIKFEKCVKPKKNGNGDEWNTGRDGDEDDEFDDYEQPAQISNGMTPLIFDKNYHFFVGHTNFDIKKNHIYGIQVVPGVEVLKPITRYRFLVAIGVQFDSTKVQNEIIKKVTEDNDDAIYNISSGVEASLITQLSDNYRAWVVFKENGKVDCMFGADDNEIQKIFWEKTDVILLAASWEYAE